MFVTFLFGSQRNLLICGQLRMLTLRSTQLFHYFKKSSQSMNGIPVLSKTSLPTVALSNKGFQNVSNEMSFFKHALYF